MFGLFKKKINTVTMEEIKSVTRVLIIDDDNPEELRNLLKKDGWKIYYLADLDSLENRKLKDSHIICIDIMGVGKALQCNSGMELVKHIKQKYPTKKIILYSSVSKQDIFSDALDYVDKRLRKESSLLPFSKAVEEMSKKTFSWEEATKYAYLQLKKEMPKLEYAEFKSFAEKSISNRSINSDTLSQKAGIGLDVASKAASLIGLAVSL
jgi:DNA-binding NtrC family response regulator